MDSKLLSELIASEEGLKLDFKQKFYNFNREDNPDKNSRERQTDEFIKDVLALTNGNIGTANETAYLIIGVGDSLHEDGTRDLYDVDVNKVKSKDIMEILNGGIYPPLPNIKIHSLKLADSNIVAVEIPPSRHLHETKRHLKTPKTEFHPGTVLVRRSEGIYPSIESERVAIRKEKDILIREEEDDVEVIDNAIDLSQEELEYSIRKKRFFSRNPLNNSRNTRKVVHWVESVLHWIDINDVLNKNPSLFTDIYIDLASLLEEMTRRRNINNDLKSRIYYMSAKIEYFLSHDSGEAFVLCKRSIRYRKDYEQCLLFGLEICNDLVSYDNIYKEEAQNMQDECKYLLEQLKNRRGSS